MMLQKLTGNVCPFCDILVTDAGKWTGERLRRLGSLVKGLDLDDINKLGKEAFEEAVGVWGQYLDVDMETLKALAEKMKEVRENFYSILVQNNEIINSAFYGLHSIAC